MWIILQNCITTAIFKATSSSAAKKSESLKQSTSQLNDSQPLSRKRCFSWWNSFFFQIHNVLNSHSFQCNNFFLVQAPTSTASTCDAELDFAGCDQVGRQEWRSSSCRPYDLVRWCESGTAYDDWSIPQGQGSHPACVTHVPEEGGQGWGHDPQWKGSCQGWSECRGFRLRPGLTLWSTAGDGAAPETADPSECESAGRHKKTLEKGIWA